MANSMLTDTSTQSNPEIRNRPTPSFSVESSVVLQRLRSNISEMLNSMPGRVRSSRDLQKLFGLDLKLCWQLMKLAGPGDALSLAPFVPTAGPMKRFLVAAQGFGVSKPVLEQIRHAFDSFEEQVITHAGDRATFESMANGSVGHQQGSDEDLRRSDVKLRKAGFQMHSRYCGAQMDTYLVASILHPSSTPGKFDLAHIRMKLGLRRLHAGVAFLIDSFKYTATTNIEEEQDTQSREPIDKESFASAGAPVMAKFCTNPLPLLQTVTQSDGRTYTSLLGDDVGLQSAVNITFGRVLRQAPMEELDRGKIGFGHSASIITPTVILVLDQLVHRPSFPNVEFKSSVDWRPAYQSIIPGQHQPPLAFRERIIKLEAGVDGARTREIPQYFEVMDYVCRQLNWNVEDLDVYRMRLDYPMLHTNIWTTFEATPAI